MRCWTWLESWQNMISWRSDVTWWRRAARSLSSRRGADYQLWNNSRLRSAFSLNLWSCVCTHSPRITALTGCYDLICHPRWREATVFSCLLFQHDGSCETMHLCLSPTALFRFMKVETFEWSVPILNRTTFQVPPFAETRLAIEARPGIAFVAWQQ